jgi:hypothetical protein
MLPKDRAMNDLGLLGLCNVGHTVGKYSIPVIGSAIFGQKSNKALESTGQSRMIEEWGSFH